VNENSCDTSHGGDTQQAALRKVLQTAKAGVSWVQLSLCLMLTRLMCCVCECSPIRGLSSIRSNQNVPTVVNVKGLASRTLRPKQVSISPSHGEKNCFRGDTCDNSDHSSTFCHALKICWRVLTTSHGAAAVRTLGSGQAQQASPLIDQHCTVSSAPWSSSYSLGPAACKADHVSRVPSSFLPTTVVLCVLQSDWFRTAR
jgi:hypothetical protein